MELTWKGYVFSVRVWRKQAEAAQDPATKEVSMPQPSERRREEIDKEYILASGSRYVGPTR